MKKTNIVSLLTGRRGSSLKIKILLKLMDYLVCIIHVEKLIK